MKIAIIGAGSWGTALGKTLGENGHEVVLWSRRAETADSINQAHKNERYLPQVTLPESVRATSDLSECVHGAEVVIVAVPSAYAREVIRETKSSLSSSTCVIHVIKGLEHGTGKFMTEVISEELAGTEVAVLSGPNHAEEVGLGLPTATTLAHPDKSMAVELSQVFSNASFKAYPHDDVIGVQVCGVMKNIIAVAVGVIGGLGLGDNAKGSIVTLGLREMALLSETLGGKKATCYGLAGIGDLVASCFSDHSRNRKAGELLAKGTSPENIPDEMNGMVAEGVRNIKAVHNLSVKKGLELALVSQAHRVLYEGVDLKKGISELLEKV